MNDLIRKLNETTLGEAAHKVRDMSLTDAILSFTGLFTVAELVSALFAELRNDETEAGRSLGTAYVCLLINALLTVLTGETDEEAEEE